MLEEPLTSTLPCRSSWQAFGNVASGMAVFARHPPLSPFQLKLGPLVQMGGGAPGAAPALARGLSTSGPSVSLARLPPLRKLASVVMTHAVRQALLHLDDVILAAADNTPTKGSAASGAGAGAATGTSAASRCALRECSFVGCCCWSPRSLSQPSTWCRHVLVMLPCSLSFSL